MNVDAIFPYKPSHSGIHAKCRVRIYPPPVVVVTELPDNPGMSVTNYAEELATLILQEHGLDALRTVWIEHYPAWAEEDRPETFDLVRFTWDGERYTRPEWRRLMLEEVERLTGDDDIADN